MAPRLARTLGYLAALTVLFGLSLGAMFLTVGRFDPIWFGVSLGVYVLVGLVVLLRAFRASQQAAAEIPWEEEVALAEMRRARGPASLADLQAAGPLPTTVSVSKATGQIPTPAPAVAAYRLRGFTLYERTTTTKSGETKAVRFFSKTPPKSGRSIAVPDGYAVRWDPKKKQPRLEASKRPPQEEAEPLELPSRVEAVRGGPTLVEGHRCAAMPRPGEFCRRGARERSRFCAAHARWKPEQAFGVVEARLDRPSAGGRGRGRAARAAGSFVVQTARPTVPGRVRRLWNPAAGNLRVQTAKATPEGEAIRRVKGPLEVRVAKPRAAGALRVAPVEPEVRLAKRRPEPAPRVSPVEARVRQDKPAPRYLVPVRPQMPELDVKVPRGRAEPIPTRKVSGLEVRLDKPKAKRAPALRSGWGEPVVVVPKGDLGRRDGRPSRRTTPARGAARTRPKELVVVRDTKRRSKLGVGTDLWATGRPRRGSRKR